MEDTCCLPPFYFSMKKRRLCSVFLQQTYNSAWIEAKMGACSDYGKQTNTEPRKRSDERKKNKKNSQQKKIELDILKTYHHSIEIYHHCRSLSGFIRAFQNLMPFHLSQNCTTGFFVRGLFGDRVESNSVQDVLKNQSLYWPQSPGLLSLKSCVYQVKALHFLALNLKSAWPLFWLQVRR